MTEMILLTTVKEPGMETKRKDNWWLKPFIQGSILLIFGIYPLIAIIFGGDNFKVDKFNYVSPLFNPEIEWSKWPKNVSPGLMFIWIPIGFRATCYYARKVYYRAFFLDPPGCAVGELRKVDQKYKGENAWPFILNNLHRYFFYLALILAIFHWISFFDAFFIDGGIRLGLGGIILLMDALFLSLYLMSCHSCKHIIGGGLDCFSCTTVGTARYKSWRIVKKLNTKHHLYFWLSLTSVIVADVYIRLLSMGSITDWVIF